VGLAIVLMGRRGGETGHSRLLMGGTGYWSNGRAMYFTGGWDRVQSGYCIDGWGDWVQY